MPLCENDSEDLKGKVKEPWLKKALLVKVWWVDQQYGVSPRRLLEMQICESPCRPTGSESESNKIPGDLLAH